MSKEKRAAIDQNGIGDKKLDEITASEFLSALNEGNNSLKHLTVWPEKKKVELWVEPENLGNIRVIDIIEKIRNEKKKVELEKTPIENWRDPRGRAYDDLLDRLADDLEERIQMKQ